ncbi:MAG: SUF system Fe-S cluster assembly regulator [Pseudomonadota bacterium]
MLRLSKLTDYGTVVLAHMASNPEQLYSATDIAQAVRLADPTVRKLLKLLSKGGITESHRGAQGGYRLSRNPDEISAAQIIDTLEGPIAITECSTASNHCCLENSCALSGKWQKISHAIRNSLEHVSLADLAAPDFDPKLNLGNPLSNSAHVA